MASMITRIKNTWAAINYPDGVSEEYDKKCDDEFDKVIDRFISFCYFVFYVVASISIYFFITKELL